LEYSIFRLRCTIYQLSGEDLSKETIVVCGATGSQGKAAVQALLKNGSWNVIALSLDPESARAQSLKTLGAELRKGDIEDKTSLLKVFANAYGVFAMTQPWSADYKKCDTRKEVLQGRNIAEACQESGVKHLVLSTVINFGAKETGIPHIDSKLEIEDYVLQKSIPHTLLRPASFMDNIGMNFFPVKPGIVKGFIDGDAKVPYIACADIGAFAVLSFNDPKRYIGKGINLIGDFVSGDELCVFLSKLRNGESFRYKSVPKLLLRFFPENFF
jgi:uncharacterized protein YbjT (DUF2867 family)